MYTTTQQKELLQLAKEAIQGKAQEHKKRYTEKRGVFVSLHKYGQLRGCIGYIEPIFSLQDAIIKAARAAAYSDPRFAPLHASEIDNITIEISILSPPEALPSAKDPLSHIQLGTHGIILKHPLASAVFLPQVPVEWNWNAQQYLEQLCKKAGLSSNAWQDKEAKLFTFTAEVFSED